MKSKLFFFSSIVVITLVSAIISCKEKTETDAEHDYSGLSEKEKLGKKIFFDKNISSPVGQSCASCHSITAGFSDPNHAAFSHGVINKFMGSRSASSIAYMHYSPALYYNKTDSTYMGGFFWDGRASSLETQAIKPMLDSTEMNNTSITQIINKLKNAEYSNLFKQVYGENIFDDTTAAIQSALSAIVAFEKSLQVNPFTSKYDYYLKGEVNLTAQEMRGLKLFNDTAKTKCTNCHPSVRDKASGQILFTDFSYDNIGVPHNTNSKTNIPDYGLGGFLKDTAHYGKFKVPTLRNVAVTAPYFHNGYFNTLEEVVQFYADRDSIGKYPSPEVIQNINREEMGKLNLSKQDVSDIASFLRTLTDGYKK